MALAIVRELGRAGYHVVSVGRGALGKKPLGCQPLGHSSRYTKERVTLSDDNYAQELLSLAASRFSEGQKPVLFPTGMFTLNAVSEKKSEFLSAYDALIPGRDALENAGDKLKASAAANEIGLDIPETYPEDAPCFPCVVKYINGEALNLTAGNRYAIVDDPEAYRNTLEKMKTVVTEKNIGDLGREASDNMVFISQYIAGGAFGVSALLGENSEAYAVFCHRRIREYPASGGPACCAESIWDQNLAVSALALFKKMKLTGFAMAEFKGTPERPYFLEINPRVWGTYPLSALSGAGFAGMYVRAALGLADVMNKIECKYKTGVRMQYLANDLARAFAVKGSALLYVMRDFFSPRRRGGVFDIKDLPGSAAYVMKLLSRGARE
jgi:predicted ATP-grasp superfamily ATP-dependent carboligase